MKTTALAGLTLCLALLPGSTLIGGIVGIEGLEGIEATQDPRAPHVPMSERQRAEVERLAREIQGLWRVDSVRIGDTTFQGPSVDGFLLAAPQFLSLEVHVENAKGGSASDPVDYLFQTGIYEYRFAALGEITMATVIGTNGLDAEEVDFEPGGARRQYRITLTGEQLVLDRRMSALNLVRVSRPEHTIEKRQ